MTCTRRRKFLDSRLSRESSGGGRILTNSVTKIESWATEKCQTNLPPQNLRPIRKQRGRTAGVYKYHSLLWCQFALPNVVD
jgi:hypothetical protein